MAGKQLGAQLPAATVARKCLEKKAEPLDEYNFNETNNCAVATALMKLMLMVRKCENDDDFIKSTNLQDGKV